MAALALFSGRAYAYVGAPGMSAAEQAHLDEITEWAYQNSPYALDHPCSAACQSLTSAENALPATADNAGTVFSGAYDTAAGADLLPALPQAGEALEPVAVVGPSLAAFATGYVIGTGIRHVFIHERTYATPYMAKYADPSAMRAQYSCAKVVGTTWEPCGWYLIEKHGDDNTELFLTPNAGSCYGGSPGEIGYFNLGMPAQCTWHRDQYGYQIDTLTFGEGLNYMGPSAYLDEAPTDTLSTPPDARTVGAPPDQGFDTARSGVQSLLNDGNHAGLNGWLDAQLGGSGDVTVPDCVGESYGACQADLVQAGLAIHAYTLSESDPDVAAGQIAETLPESGDTVQPGTTVEVAKNPAVTGISEEDPRCDLNSGGAQIGDPGDAPPDGTGYPAYQLVEDSPYPVTEDPTGSSPAVSEMPLRYGNKRWGWRHILQKHPFTSGDRQQTIQALAADPAPVPTGFATANQWDFHLFYSMDNGQGDGGHITCLRTVRVEYLQDRKARNAGLEGIRGIQNSFTGIYIGGLTGY